VKEPHKSSMNYLATGWQGGEGGASRAMLVHSGLYLIAMTKVQ